MTVGPSVQERLYLLQDHGCCSQSALAGQCQRVPVLGGCGGGLAAPSPRE